VRVVLVGLGLWWTCFLAAAPAYARLWLELALGPALGLVALTLLFELATARWRPGAAKLARALLVALALAPPLLEVALRVLAEMRPSQLFARDERLPGRVLERNRVPGGTVRFGTKCNAGGHFDGEFRRRAAGERRIALIGDSFSQGIVPHELHYSTVAERALGFPVDNLGQPGTGPLEYEEMLLHEALELDPSAVVVAFFVGNDFEMPPELPSPDPFLSSWLDRRGVLLWLLPRRLARMVRERRENPAGIAGVQAERFSDDDLRSLAERMPWLFDPLLEEPTISKPVFLEVERARAHLVCGIREYDLLRAVRVLERMRRECDGRPFGVLLVPDEFQVEDELWAELGSEELERDRAQRLLARELGQRGIPVLDLQAALRAVEPLADGRRHVYHRQDTHWNARGNRVAGEALAGFVRELAR